MNSCLRYALLAGAALAALHPATALAQSEKPTASAPDEIGEVVVTARRKAENIQTVPIAITAISQSTLKDNNIASVVDLQTQVPSLTSNSYGRDSAQVSLRGQGGYSPGGSPSVTSYFNEVPAPILGLGSYFDLAGVEVLKGPQGTLFGRNSTGGAITVTSKRPTNDFGGYLEGTLGNYNNKAFDAALNAPLIDGKLLLRLAATGQWRDGYTILQGTVAQPNKKIDLDDRNYYAGRATLTYKPVEGVQNDLILDYFRLDTNGTSNILSAVNPTGISQFLFPTFSQDLAAQRALGVRKEIRSLVDNPMFRNINEGVTDIFSWQVSDDLTVRNILGFRRTSLSYQKNPTGGTLPILTFPTRDITPQITDQYTEELQLQGKSMGGKLSWVVGGYYQNNPTPPFFIMDFVTLGGARTSWSRVAEKSHALYGQATYDLADLLQGLKFTAGYRYTWDTRSLQSRSFTRGVCSAVGADATCTIRGKAKFKAPTWTLDMDYQFSPGSMVYVTSRRGYRSGGFNSFATVAADAAFAPEYVTDLEVGLKSTFSVAGMRARTNLAAYHQWYKDVQVPVTKLVNGASQSLTLNAASAKLDGVEFEGELAPTQDLRLFLNYAFGEAKFTKFDSAAALASNQSFRWANLPRHKVTLGATWFLPVDPDVGEVSLTGAFTWQEHFYNVTTKDPWDTTPDVGLVNLSANWRKPFGKPIDVSAFVTNATNRTYSIGGFNVYSSLGYSSPVFSEPRMFGIRLRYHFGAE